MFGVNVAHSLPGTKRVMGQSFELSKSESQVDYGKPTSGQSIPETCHCDMDVLESLLKVSITGHGLH